MLIETKYINKIEPDSVFNESYIRKGVIYSFKYERNHVKIIHTGVISLKARIQSFLIKKIESAYSRDTASILKTLYFGENVFTDKKVLFEFKRAGVLHVLAASGMHVGILAAVPFFLLGAFRVNKKIIYLITSLFVFCFFYITNMPVSLFRACVMFWIISAAFCADLEKKPVNILFLSGIVIAFIFPYEIYSLGFQLSFGATMGILFFYKKFHSIVPGPFCYIKSSLALTLSAQVFVYPIIAARLNEINFSGLFSNIFVVPASSFLLLNSISGCFLKEISERVASPVIQTTELLLKYGLEFISFVSKMKGHFYLDHPCSQIIPFVLFVLPLFSGRLSFKTLLWKRLILACALFSSFVPLYVNSIGSKNEIYYFEDNPGSFLIKSGYNYVLSGYFNDDDFKIINKIIDNSGYEDINIFLDEVDDKNVSCFKSFMKRYKINRLYTFRPSKKTNKYVAKLVSLAEEENIVVEIFDYNVQKGFICSGLTLVIYKYGTKTKKNKVI